MQVAPAYDDVVTEVRDFLVARAAACEAAGIARERIVIDPGFGFGKTLAHNLDLVAVDRDVSRRPAIRCSSGLSRKSSLGEITGRSRRRANGGEPRGGARRGGARRVDRPRARRARNRGCAQVSGTRSSAAHERRRDRTITQDGTRDDATIFRHRRRTRPRRRAADHSRARAEARLGRGARARGRHRARRRASRRADRQGHADLRATCSKRRSRRGCRRRASTSTCPDRCPHPPSPT